MASPSDGWSSFLGPNRGGHASILLFHSMPALLYLGICTTLWGLGIECLQPSLDISGKLHVSSSCISSLVLSKFLAEQVKGQLRQLILVASCWMEACWLPTVLNMLADIPQSCPIIKDLIMDVSVGQVLKGVPYLHLTLWLFSNVCYTDGFSSSVCQAVAGATQASMSEVYQQCWKEWASWCAQQGVPNNAISAPKLANFWYIYFRLAWPGVQLVYIVLVFLPFWSLIIFTRLLIILSSQN